MIKKITEDIEGGFKFNTAISGLMELINATSDYLNSTPENEWNLQLLRELIEKLVLILSPFAPHMADELYSDLGYKGSLMLKEWPSWDEEALKAEEIEIAVLVNGKVRDKMVIPANLDEEKVKEVALSRDRIRRILGEKYPKKVFYVKGRIVNIVM